MADYVPKNEEIIRTALAAGYSVQRDYRSYAVTMRILLEPGMVAGGRSAGPSDPTAAIALSIEKHYENWREVCASLAEAAGAFVRAERLMGEITRVANTEEVAKALDALRCSGLGHEGYDTWGDPTCTAAKVTKDGLCDRCRQRRDHWRRNERAA